MKRKVVCLLFILVCLTGCWDRKEINDVALPVAMGIDYKDEKINVTLYLTVPKSSGPQNAGNGESPTYVQSASGENIGDALSKLQASMSRRIFLGHTKIFIFGEKLAEHGIEDTIDFLLRYPETRLHSFIFVAKGKASKILETQSFVEDTVAEEAKELAKSKIELSMTLKDFTMMNYSPIKTALLPLLEVDKENKKEDKGPIKLKGGAIFSKGKMVAQVDDELTRGLLWIRNEIESATVTIKPEEAKGAIAALILQSDTELIPKVQGDKWKITVKTTSEDDIIQNSSEWSLLEQKNLIKVQRELEKRVEKRITETLNLFQKELKLDVLGFSNAFRKKYPQEWKKYKNKWEEKFPQIDVTIDSTVFVRRIGQSTIPKEVKQ